MELRCVVTVYVAAVVRSHLQICHSPNLFIRLLVIVTCPYYKETPAILVLLRNLQFGIVIGSGS